MTSLKRRDELASPAAPSDPEQHTMYDPSRPGVPFPERRSIRAEDVVVTPPIEAWLGRLWFLVRPTLRVLAEFCRINPLIPFAICLVLVSMLAFGPSHQRNVRARQLEAFRQQARDEVDAVLQVIGHSVRVDRVEVSDLDAAAAIYRDSARLVVFDLELEGHGLLLLQAAAHECVHAIFDQASLSRYREGLRYQIVEETAAEVLGAHLAGRVITGRGEDGPVFTRRVVSRYRLACSDDSAFSVKQHVFERLIRSRGEGVDPATLRLALSHFGNERLVDEIDLICQQHPDPWDAAHAIARAYGLN